MLGAGESSSAFAPNVLMCEGPGLGFYLPDVEDSKPSSCNVQNESAAAFWSSLLHHQNSSNLAARIREAFPDGVDGVADGAVQNELAIPAVRDGGGFATVRGWRGTGERGVVVHATSVFEYDHRRDLLERLGEQVEAGELTLRVAQTYRPEEAAEAHRRLAAGGTRGRLVIEFA